MSATGIEVFDTTLQKTNQWLQDIMRELGTENRQQAYLVLRATLHTLRDRLPLEEVAHLGAQLPMLVRGIYYEGWRPSLEVRKLHREEFLASVLVHFAGTALEDSDPELAIRAAFSTLARNIAPGEIDKVIHLLPKDLREFWRLPQTGTARAQSV